MANALYGKAKEELLGTTAGTRINWINDTVKMTLVDNADYTVSIDVDDFYNDVPAAGRVATSAALSSKTSALGVADAADVTFASVTGDVSESLVIWKDSGVETTSPLIAYIDTGTGLPVTPNGGNITVTFDSGANKIFKL